VNTFALRQVIIKKTEVGITQNYFDCLCDIQTGSGACPASYPMGTRDFPGCKVAKA